MDRVDFGLDWLLDGFGLHQVIFGGLAFCHVGSLPGLLFARLDLG